MNLLVKLVRLNKVARALLVRAWLAQMLIRLGLSVLPFARMRRIVSAYNGQKSAQQALRCKQNATTDIKWAIATTAKYVPAATCLIQAMAFEVLARPSDISVQTHFGVHRDEAGHLEAHSWVEADGCVILGLTKMDHFTVLKGR